MKNISNIRLLFLLTAFFIAFPLLIKAQDLPRNEERKNMTFEEMRSASESIWKDIPVDQRKGTGWKAFKRWEDFWETRVKENGTLPSPSEIASTFKALNVENKKTSKLQAVSPQWTNLGPIGNPDASSGGSESGVGRINVVRFDPNNSKIMWVGAAGGGVWRSTSAGKSWETFPFTQFLSLGVSDIAISNSDPSVVYVATGDANGLGGGGGDSYSIGIIKTTDYGESWTVTNLAYAFQSQVVVARVLVHPDNGNIVIATTSEGIYKSTDGGNSWVRKTSASYFKDMEFKPEDPNTLYASTFSYSNQAAIYKSTDNGESWNVVTTVNGVRRIALAVTLANPSKVYALCSGSNSAFNSFRVSSDNGDTWTTTYSITTGVNLLGRDEGTGSDKSVGQGWYDLCLAVAPYDENEIFTGGINIWKSNDGGSSWSMISHWYGGYGKPYVHADIHDLVYDENQGFLFATHDGGIDRTIDLGVKWTNLNNGMDITQYYRLACAAKDKNVIYGGAQDNGSHRYAGNGIWNKVYGGDGMDCAVDWEETMNAYVSIYNGNLYRTSNGFNFNTMLTSSKTGENGAWVTPFIVSPIKAATLYAGYRNVWKSYDYGRNWSKAGTLSGNNQTLRSLAQSPTDSNYIYAANLNQMWMTSDAGMTWSRIGNVPNYISSIAVHPTNPRKIYITNEGFSANDKIYEYDGTTLKNISGNLPNIPVSIVVCQKDSPDRLYIGTDFGVYFSDYNSAYWEKFGTGMPNLIVNDLEIHYGSGKLRAATYGRGIWEADLIKCNITQPKVKIIGRTIICDGESSMLEAEQEYPNMLWSTGEKTKSIKVDKSGYYSLLIEDQSGCTARSEGINITVKTFTPAKINPVGKFPPCEGDEMNLELSVPMGYTKYQWSTGDSTRRIKITVPGIYTVTVNTNDTCTSTALFEVKIMPKPPKPRLVRWNYEMLWTDPAPSFVWYLNDTIIKGESGQILKMTKLGDYRVQAIDSNGCGTLSDPMTVISDVKEIQPEIDQIQVYPNPADERINYIIPKDLSAKVSLKLYNSFGSEVLSLENITNDGTVQFIELNRLSVGMYNLVLITESGNYSYKFIKK